MKSLDLMGFNFSVDFCTACSLSQLDSIPRLTPEIFSVLPRMGHASTIWMQGVQVKSLGMVDAQAVQLRPELPYKFRRCWLINRSDLSALKSYVIIFTHLNHTVQIIQINQRLVVNLHSCTASL